MNIVVASVVGRGVASVVGERGVASVVERFFASVVLSVERGVAVTPAASSAFDFLVIETQAVRIAQKVLSTANVYPSAY